MEDPRLPLPPSEQLDRDQVEAIRELVDGPRKALAGPFVALVHSPELMTRVQKVGEHLRFGDTSLAADIRELTVLVVAAHWGAHYEWGSHIASAVTNGISVPTCEALAARVTPRDLTADQMVAYQVVTSLLDTGTVDNVAYAAGLEAHDERWLVELTTLTGYYTTLALILGLGKVPGALPPSGLPVLAP
ncbi:MAG TPA: hypothetical protein VFE15_04020 [Marmoricola sp.]|jgi:4-carboxymuconolactone decarboxylase|nr:hypothetical protein [Marmoricola sp.]